MRDRKDQKGCVLLVIHRDTKDIEIVHKQNINRDIMLLETSIMNLKLIVVVVYFSLSDKEKQRSVKGELDQIIETSKESPILIIGDLNGHIGFLGTQTINENEKTG